MLNQEDAQNYARQLEARKAFDLAAEPETRGVSALKEHLMVLRACQTCGRGHRISPHHTLFFQLRDVTGDVPGDAREGLD
mmetsp:Transcript_112408/g.318004  ORF Transcript_112408/g.318004 Transcript_112408/m.318004 type:complete len:80 (+) Transcript_112408:716-955(+)